MEIISYNYKPGSIRSGILHIGVGNFHRAHQAFYINNLLAYEDQSEWGICGVSLLPSDQKIVEGLRLQDLNYTLTVFGRDGLNSTYKIGSLIELIWGVEAPDAVIEKIADPSIKIITLTITEGGYNIDKATNEFMIDDDKVRHDLANQGNPATVFGFIAQGLRLRRNKGLSGLTILSCDNLQHNGNTAKKAFLSFIKVQDVELANWVEDNVTFPNSMVDRITPATKPEDIIRLNGASGINDQAPVYCEDFCQWVIEDNFIAGRPAIERVGAELTNDVSAYENMKLSLLNASHTLLSYPSYLKGYRKVDEALQDEQIIKYVRQFMDIDITPYMPAPRNTNLDVYKQTLIERFSNKAVSDQLARLCADGISKIPVYIVPNLAKMIHDEKDVSRIAFLLATYRHYLKYKTDDKGLTFEVVEPGATMEDERLIAGDDAIEFLDLSALKKLRLKYAQPFVQLFLQYGILIKEQGISQALDSILI